MEIIDRSLVVAEARTWLGTPFMHLARTKGIGVDCAGIVIGVGRALNRVGLDFDVQGYSASNPDVLDVAALLDNHMIKQEDGLPLKVGQVVSLLIQGRPRPRHMGILGDYLYGGLSIIHIFNRDKNDKVVETRWMPHRNMALAAVYDYPGVI